MKKIILTGLLFFGLYTQADLSSNSEKGFFDLSVGLNVDNNDLTVSELPRFSLTYGKDIALQNNYFGFFALGIQGPILLHLKYGYEFIRENTISFGLSTTLLLGLVWYDDDFDLEKLGFGNEFGVFVKINIADSVSTLIGAGVQQQRQFKDASDLNFDPYGDVIFRYYLSSN